MWTFTSDYFYIENDDRKGRRSADQSATKVVDNSSEAEDDDIDGKHVDGGGGMMILMMNMVRLMRGRQRSRMMRCVTEAILSLEWLHIA